MTQMTYILNRLYILTALAEMDFNFEFPLKCLQPWKQSAGDKLLSRWQRTCCRRQATFSLTAEKLPETSYFLADSGKVAGDKLLSRWQRKCCRRQATFSLTAESRPSLAAEAWASPLATLAKLLHVAFCFAITTSHQKIGIMQASKITMNPILIAFCFFYKCSSCLSPWSGPRPCSSSFALGRAGRFNYHHFRLLASFLGLTL